jgi:Mor family transcriptional regulator
MDDYMNELPEIMRLIAEGGGIATALKVARAYGGGHVYIPKLDDLLRQMRDARIWEERAAGATVSAIARRYGLTERRIYDILGEEISSPPPPSLFPVE